MVTVSWGDILAIVLPGAVALLGAQRFNEPLHNLLADPNRLSASGGFFLLFVATVAGGILEGVRRVLFDELLPTVYKIIEAVGRFVSCQTSVKNTAKIPNVYGYITPQNQAVFEMLVQGSYKYQVFYGNLVCAMAFVLAARRFVGSKFALIEPLDGSDLAIAIAAVFLFVAGLVQRHYFNQQVIGFINAAKSSSCKENPLC
ncbi:MAG: hypothetical protein WA993_18125 [Candidatus Binatus sp.]|jgi:hypothetical protein